MVDDRGQVALPTAVGDLIDADRHQALQALFIEVIGKNALNDVPDGVPADPQHAGDRRLRHLLREPGHDILEVACVLGTRPCPRHRLQVNAAVRAAQAP